MPSIPEMHDLTSQEAGEKGYPVQAAAKPPVPQPQMRYYATPSKTQIGSWNVMDRTGRAPEGGHAVEVPHLNRHQAVQEAARLNRG